MLQDQSLTPPGDPDEVLRAHGLDDFEIAVGKEQGVVVGHPDGGVRGDALDPGVMVDVVILGVVTAGGQGRAVAAGERDAAATRLVDVAKDALA